MFTNHRFYILIMTAKLYRYIPLPYNVLILLYQLYSFIYFSTRRCR